MALFRVYYLYMRHELLFFLPIIVVLGFLLFKPINLPFYQGNTLLTISSSPDVINKVLTKDKVVALTFDADMTPKMMDELQQGKIKIWYNSNLINILKDNKIPATLFLTGLWIQTYPEITKELASNPLFELANHSYSHAGFASPCYNLGTVPDNKDQSEVLKTDNLLNKYASNHKKYFRFPGLCYNDSDVKIIRKLGYTIIGGKSSTDAFRKEPALIIKTVTSNITPGEIIIFHMHIDSSTSISDDALPEILNHLKSEGYRFVKVSDLLQLGRPSI